MSKLFFYTGAFMLMLLQVIQSGSDGLTFQQKQFIDLLMPEIVKINENLLAQRSGIYLLYEQYLAEGRLTNADKEVLVKYLSFYGVPVEGHGPFTPERKFFLELLQRVDVIPPAYSIAKAAIERDWDTLFLTNTGERPAVDSAKRNVEVFIRDIALTLNRDEKFSDFRNVRAASRINSEKPAEREMLESFFSNDPLHQNKVRRLIFLIENYLKTKDDKF
ncbi:MAG: hypothetical protein ACLFPE_09315 [Bacteroidales bacterium]